MEKNSNILISEEGTIRRIHYLMGTFIEIEATGGEKEEVIETIEAAFSEIKRLEHILSRYLKISQVSHINRYACSFPVELDSEVFQLLEDAIRFSRFTEGAFDITVGSILDLLNLSKDSNFPSTEEIKQACSSVGCADIVLNRQDRTIFFKKQDIKIDLGGIGKGYAIDKAIGILKKKKINKALINAGGNIFCLDNEDYSPIGIKNPLKTDEAIAVVLLKDKAISTSANYERSFNIDGKKYGHLIDPNTGCPVSNGVLSVSIICPSAKIADILSTAVFILGQDKGMRLINSMDNLDGIIVTESGRRPKLHISTGLKKVSHLTYLPD